MPNAQPTTKELIAMLYERLPELFERSQHKPLTDDEIWGAYVKSPVHVGDSSLSRLYAFARAIEAKLKEKNNA